MFGWFRKKQAKLMPEGFWTVMLVEQKIRVTDQEGRVKSVGLAELSRVIIETNDTGPWGADVWWLFFGADSKLALAFPQGATGEKEVLDRLFSLPGFRQEEVIKAMGCTEDAAFPVWSKVIYETYSNSTIT
jgi:hypothetical protein